MATQTFTRAPRTFNTKTPTVPATTATPTTATPTVDSLRAQLGTAQQLLDQRKASSVNTPSATIPATSLTQANPVSLAPNISSATPTGLEQFITSSTIDPYKAQKQAEIDSLTKDQAGLQESIAGVYQSLVGQGARSEEIYKQLGVDSAKKEVDNLTSQIEAEQLANRRQIEELQKNNPSGLFGGALTDEVNRINTLSLQKQADLSIVQSAALRRYDTASAIADRKIQMEFEPLKVQLDALKFFYSNNQATLSKKEDQQFQQKITEDERVYNEKYQAAKTLQDTKLSVMKSLAEKGASTSVQLAVQNATSPEEALRLAAPYLSTTTTSTPTIKTINGVDYQWNPATGQWDIPNTGSAPGGDLAQKTIDQLKFLKETTQSAKDLASASGPSGITKYLGDKLVGDSKFRQLESYTNTLRTNVLTLMTDPGIKKFFGPQMSEADVRLMTAAGTTLNPENQSPEQMKKELERLSNLLGRMETALTGAPTNDPLGLF